MRVALLAALGLSLGGAARAAPVSRTPEQRQTLIELAYVLGEAHALHRVCAGKDDDTWRERMQRVIEADGTEPAFRGRLSESFNAGFVSRTAQAAGCPAAGAAERTVAAKGAVLARRLTGRSP